MEFFYLDETGEKRGPVNSAQLRALAANGDITPDTVIEAVIETGGRLISAGKIKGLVFPPPPEEPAPPAPEPEDQEKKQKERRLAAASARTGLAFWVNFLTTIAILEIAIGIIGGILLLVHTNRDDSYIYGGVGAIVGGIGSAILPLALAAIGRFLLTHHEIGGKNES